MGIFAPIPWQGKLIAAGLRRTRNRFQRIAPDRKRGWLLALQADAINGGHHPFDRGIAALDTRREIGQRAFGQRKAAFDRQAFDQFGHHGIVRRNDLEMQRRTEARAQIGQRNVPSALAHREQQGPAFFLSAIPAMEQVCLVHPVRIVQAVTEILLRKPACDQ